MVRFRWKELFLGIGVFGPLFVLILNTPVTLLAQFATSDHVSNSSFWPTQTRYSRDHYTGPETCATCHGDIAATQVHTSMARTAMLASDSAILRSRADMSFSHGADTFAIHTAGGKSVYSVTDGQNTRSNTIAWAFGTGRVAQSWLFHHDGDSDFHEARVTWFITQSGLAFTPGRALTTDVALDDAVGRTVNKAEVYRCFACHTTASGMGTAFSETHLIPGVTCEACHGPGASHAATMQGAKQPAGAPNFGKNGIFNPAKLSPEESVDFCGACHGSYWDVSLSGTSGINNARYEPYRLEQSKCWNKKDSRLTCIACHDPHKEVDTNPVSYDHVCLSCHLNTPTQPGVAQMKDANHPGNACPVARSKCTTCHMPQVYVPDMHQSFPDHRIRIAREGEAFPD